MKNIKKLLLTICILFLYSCSSADNIEKSDIATLNSASMRKVSTIQDTNTDSSSDDEPDLYEEMDYTLKNLKQQKGDIPPYQQLERQIKKVEVKKTIVKPVYNLDKQVHDFTQTEVEDFLDDISEQTELVEDEEYDSKTINLLMENYRNILQTSSACCVSSISEKLKENGVYGESLLHILKGDAHDYFVQDTCLIISNKEISDIFESKALAKIIKGVRKDCICNNKEYLRANINNFYRIYNEDPDFYKEVLIYRYKDKQGRITEHDVNETILNISLTLENCP